ncbi:adenosylhomocysteinase [Bifidobacterium tsurumiense]|uniref:S-adenosyl-L-homocysteine hydrolase n=1 Tax=Bifidobacterium tsurumiense TaxID=356829 RepID=A0A087EC71_9BIFI|nr:adenosylhomocysteinase [Bifidobacterium tsurumiense]KFJ05372.1 S-adenosyl-L-homocysteine hydrolase [Bifidobacterium tsurumiense]MDY4678318.1 adenosylhomocysteinase [Bifidobacterium tsurumiense]MSS12299.1 adenosylhomocysteinase [Bifidobacterium tsurumiense]
MPSPTFAQWAAAVSQRSNRSLAGSRLFPGAAKGFATSNTKGEPFNNSLQSTSETASHEALQAYAWGMTLAQTQEDADFDMSAPLEDITDAPNLTGEEAIGYAAEHMPVLTTLMQRFRREMDFSGIRIATCLILEPKTAVLLRELAAAGAVVGVFCEPDATDQRIADELKREGIAVEANASWNDEEAHQGALRLLDVLQPDIIIDDGGNLARLAIMERPDIASKLIGVAEETTSGIRAFQAMEDEQALPFPVIAVNNSAMKTGFDNAHGTGETCVTTIQRLLGPQTFDGSRVVVVGYGPVGEGFAKRIRSIGASVTICDSNPVAALRAVFDGFAAQDLDQCLPHADMIVSATGVRHTITVNHMRHMREGAVLAVIGGIANELALDELPSFDYHEGAVSTIHIPHGPNLVLLSQGDGVNYTAGGGNPIEIMDFSFAVQASAVAYLLRTRGHLEARLHRLPETCDRNIASVALELRGYSASQAATDNGYHWKLTRFADSREERGKTHTSQ